MSISYSVGAPDMGFLIHVVTPRSPWPPVHYWLLATYECACRGHQELIQGYCNVWKRSLMRCQPGLTDERSPLRLLIGNGREFRSQSERSLCGQGRSSARE